MNPNPLRSVRRRITSQFMTALCVLAVLVSLVPLGFILYFVLSQGIRSLNWDFFTQIPKPVGEMGGGMSNAIVGTLIVCGLGGLFADPRRNAGRCLCGPECRHAESQHRSLFSGCAQWDSIDR